MNHPLVMRAAREAFLELMNLEPAELRRQIDEHADGPLAELIMESGMMAGRELVADEDSMLVRYLVGPADGVILAVRATDVGSRWVGQVLTQAGPGTVTSHPVSFRIDGRDMVRLVGHGQVRDVTQWAA